MIAAVWEIRCRRARATWGIAAAYLLRVPRIADGSDDFTAEHLLHLCPPQDILRARRHTVDPALCWLTLKECPVAGWRGLGDGDTVELSSFNA